jgi:3-oxoacyl-[acyl-carrier protein] reductase
VKVNLEGKVALVTGSSMGIGAAIALAMAESGASVAVHYNASRAEAFDTAERLRRIGADVEAYAQDLSERGSAERLAESVLARFDRVDVLVNNAGTMVRRCAAAQVDDDYFDAVLSANLYSTVACCRAFLPAMLERHSGSIINMSSVAARNGGGPGATLYGAAKAAVATYTRGLAREVAPHGIRVNAISPGLIRTRFHERFSTPESLAAMVTTIPQGRAGEPHDVAGPALFLAADALSGYVTGQVLEVNGGMFTA